MTRRRDRSPRTSSSGPALATFCSLFQGRAIATIPSFIRVWHSFFNSLLFSLFFVRLIAYFIHKYISNRRLVKLILSPWNISTTISLVTVVSESRGIKEIKSPEPSFLFFRRGEPLPGSGRRIKAQAAARVGQAGISDVDLNTPEESGGRTPPPQLHSKGINVIIRNRKRAFLLCACSAVLIYLSLVVTIEHEGVLCRFTTWTQDVPFARNA